MSGIAQYNIRNNDFKFRKITLDRIIKLIREYLSKKSLIIINSVLLFLVIINYYYFNIKYQELENKKKELIISQAKDEQDKNNKENIKVVIDFLTALARKKSSNLWLDKATFTADKCELSLELKGGSTILEFYQYILAVIYFKPTFKILSIDIQKKGYTSRGNDPSDNQDGGEVKTIPYEVAYLLQLQAHSASMEKEKKSENEENDKIQLPYNYQYDVKFSVCN